MTFPYTKVTGHLNLADHEFVDTSCPPDQPPFVDPLAMNSMTPSKDRALKLAIHRVKQDASSVSVEQSNTFEEGSTGLTQEISPENLIMVCPLGDAEAQTVHIANSAFDVYHRTAAPSDAPNSRQDSPTDTITDPGDGPFTKLSDSLEAQLKMLIDDFKSNAYDRLVPVNY